MIAGLVREEGQLLLRFHAFGDDGNIQTMAEPDHRADDRRRLRIASQIHHECAVDLDLVERKRLQIGQRGIAAAEIVHGDADAERLQPPQQRQAAIEVIDQHALGDLEFQPPRGQPGFEQIE
jgi:hypothetical protein